MGRPAAPSLAMVLILGVLGTHAAAQDVGSPAPDFAVKNQDGKLIRLSDFKGKKAVLLSIYPKDDTGGCTRQACALRDGVKTFEDKDVVILGVSRDSMESHKKWIEKINLPYDLLADTEGDLHQAYGFEGRVRALILISKDGNVAFTNRKYDLKEESWNALLKAVSDLK
jgi:peroxiredoxin Q/BCP